MIGEFLFPTKAELSSETGSSIPLTSTPPLTSSWQLCSYCGKPPISGGKLLRCRNCQVAVYHGPACQKLDWRCGHKQICQSLESIFVPLKSLIESPPLHSEAQAASSTSLGWNTSNWWATSLSKQNHHEALWGAGRRLWHEKAYLEAVEYFQEALETYQLEWERLMKGLKVKKSQIQSNTKQKENDSRGKIGQSKLQDHFLSSEQISFGWNLARHLLFCAYCEADGQQVESGRIRLVQCISILFSLSKMDELEDNRPKDYARIWHCVWMELMLSFEEEAKQRMFSKDVSALAISAAEFHGTPSPWQHPIQRPGYLAPTLPLSMSPSFVARSLHPRWCRELEDAYPVILREYRSLRAQGDQWSQVGSGSRGSGNDDHRVVAGKDWKEWILFGTGSRRGSAPETEALLKRIVPGAVSLALGGGGEVIFSKLAPRTHIQAHCGPTNLRWTAHLGLDIPNQIGNNIACGIRVGPIWYSWEPGRVLLFDDSYEHEVRNDTDQERVVLLLRVWHPNLDSTRREAYLTEAQSKKEQAIERRYNPPP